MALDALAGRSIDTVFGNNAAMSGPAFRPVSLVTVPEPAPVELGADVSVAGVEASAKIAAGWLGFFALSIAAFYVWTHNHQG